MKVVDIVNNRAYVLDFYINSFLLSLGDKRGYVILTFKNRKTAKTLFSRWVYNNKVELSILPSGYPLVYTTNFALATRLLRRRAISTSVINNKK